MNDTSVTLDVLDRLSGEWDALTPEAQKAARYVLENPNTVGVSTVREIAEFAQVKPNTFVRMARAIGFEGYEDFREPFREAIRSGTASFPDRARWLQQVGAGGAMGALYADMVANALRNIEETFAGISADELQAAARMIWDSDSLASPVIRGADHGFVVAADTPQFFPSSVSTIALLETLLSFVIAAASPEIVARVEKFHKRRHELGIYAGEGS